MILPSCKYKIGDKVIVIREECKEYGVEGFVTKVGFSECEILMQDNKTSWFCDHWLEKLEPKKRG